MDNTGREKIQVVLHGNGEDIFFNFFNTPHLPISPNSRCFVYHYYAPPPKSIPSYPPTGLFQLKYWIKTALINIKKQPKC